MNFQAIMGRIEQAGDLCCLVKNDGLSFCGKCSGFLEHMCLWFVDVTTDVLDEIVDLVVMGAGVPVMPSGLDLSKCAWALALLVCVLV